LARQSKPPEYYLAQAHAMVRQAKRTPDTDAQRAYLKLAQRWEQLAREAGAQRGNPPPAGKPKPH